MSGTIINLKRVKKVFKDCWCYFKPKIGADRAFPFSEIKLFVFLKREKDYSVLENKQ